MFFIFKKLLLQSRNRLPPGVRTRKWLSENGQPTPLIRIIPGLAGAGLPIIPAL
jgi:hypothetical protein